ncbi:BspA family leucine-rich repeat surface protein [Oceanihabitans sp. IOP_32]|uniref:BspA family leucine-rich repeat surface protein n=1 Tax=Oceanihabitans sp. IOP_32 TaxID=2529032 RepID=UPI00129309BA|nr:BspA family leucine-rich repeat surface protein [Oceanihabitans sp. IOP_32]QFZ55859.1 BspA family leucine-rich repeat surface protein [Oceanihabitans sp. IOP_32]
MKKLLQLFILLFLFISTSLYAQAGFESRWNTTNLSTGSSGNNQITIPTNPAFTYNYTVDWGDTNIDSNVTGNITHTYTTPGIYTITITGTFPAIYFNNDGDRLKITEILSWGTTIQWQSMENAFYGCENLNFDAINSPDLSQVTSLRNMFRGCTSFNGILNNWDVSTITDISGLFAEAGIFNRPLESWNTINVTDMSYTFHQARRFNEPLDNWNTASVTTLEYTFSEANDFNQNINNWDVSQVTNMYGAFRYTGNFNNPLNNWVVTQVTNMSSMFQGSGFNQPIANWNVNNVTNMSAMFRESLFNHPIEIWNVSSVTNMREMFHRHRTYNHPLNNWDVSNVTNMASMFDGWLWDAIYNQPLNNWDVSKVTDMRNMFRENSAFNQDISSWDVSSVTNMSGMFQQTPVFNQDISSWVVTNVTNMAYMFNQATVFNQPLNTWNVSNVVNMSYMFDRALAFNQPLNTWNVSNVTNMRNMFNETPVFNQPLNNWDTTNVTNFSAMFNSASSFDQNLGNFNISNANNMINMLSNSGLSQTNYDDTLIGWATQTVNNNITLGATNLQYCDGRFARQQLIDSNNWSFAGDIINCSFVLCTNLVSPLNGDTNVPASANLVWQTTPNAAGYRVTVRIIRGGIESIPFNDFDVGNNTALNLETPLGADLLVAGDQVFVTIVPYNSSNEPAVNCVEESFTVVESWVNSPDAFKFTIDTRNLDTNSSAANQIRLELLSGLTYNFSVDWGDDQFNNNVSNPITHTYAVPGIYTISIIGNYPAHYYGSSNRDNLKLISMDQWGTQVWESMANAFYYCENMVYNTTDVPNLANVTNMSGMFSNCLLFNNNIDNWDVSSVTNMYRMFIGARLFNQPLNSWNVSNVTNMSDMFLAATAFNQPLDNWNTANVTDMSRMFESASVFNQNINNWNVSNVTNMASMFDRALVYNQPLNNWDVSNVTDMSKMFTGLILSMAFNQPIGMWDVSNVTDMSEMFKSSTSFNQPLNTWNTANVTTMNSMFEDADSFNQPLNNWDVSSVTNMGRMFQAASVFNQNINSWNVTNVIFMQSMFFNATAFNEPLNNWDVNSVVNMSRMFRRASSFNQPLNSWNVSAVANMSSMFEDAIAFNQPLDNWDVSSVTLMESMFEGATVFNQNINAWNVGVVTQMEALFKEAVAYNQPLNNWNTREALTMQEMFRGATAFNQPIDSWDVSYVTNMEEMFRNATVFNQTMNSWNVASVTTMRSMFEEALAFNAAIGNWNVRAVTTMQNMFSGATNFNQNINNWRVFNVENMNYMFRNATAFNQPLNQWSFGAVSMNSMLFTASAFNQYLGDWDISGVSDMTDMLDRTAITRENYDNTLIAWSQQALTPNITLGAEGLLYCDALEERQTMIDNFGWTIADDILDCPLPTCTQLVSPLNGATNVPVNTNLTWDPTLFARGYRLTVGTSPGGNDIVDNEVVNDTSYEFTSDFTGGETVYVTLIPFNDTGNAIGPCVEESFSISTDAATVPNCTTLTAPVNNATNVTVGTNLSWQPIADADGYQLSIGTSAGATDILPNTNVGNVTIFDLPTDLPEDTDIFVSIIPFNDQGLATACASERFTTELIPAPPVCTNLTNPLNGGVNVPLDTNISWSAVPNATGYLVIVGTTQGGNEIVNNVDVNNNTSYVIPTNLQPNRTYYVTIIPYNAIGDAMGCAEESFRTGTSLINAVPACTSLTMPLNNATNVAVGTNIEWNAVANTTGYNLTIGTTSGGDDILPLTDLGNATTYNLVSDLPEATTIFVTITPYNAIGDAVSCTEESFTTETLATAPNCTTLISPLNNATNVSVSTNLTWTAITNADGYRISIGTTSGGIELVDNEVLGNVTSYNPINDFPENTTIYVRITPFNAFGDAVNCSEESFTTETLATVPNCTTLTSPLNNATNVSVSTNLTWTAITNADGYRISIGTTVGGIDLVDNEVLGNVTSYNPINDFPENTTIYVRITPFNAVGDAVNCSEESFTTETLATVPNCTTLTSPLNNATNVSVSTNLTWTAITNADGYRISIGTTAGGIELVDNEVLGNVTSYNPINDFPENTTIYVRITPFNAVGDAVNCSEESFTTETLATAPNCTTLTSPLNNATNVAVSTNITWNAVADADGYRISIGTTAGGSELVSDEVLGNVTSYNLTNNLPENTTIYVRVIPFNSIGDAINCAETSFTTETLIPECTTLTYPLNNDTDIPIDTDLSWNTVDNATGYRLSIGTTVNGTDILNNEDVGLATSYNGLDNFAFDSIIYVSVTPYNNQGDALNCDFTSFTTETEPLLESKYGLSPNGDGINDFWEIRGIENSPQNTVNIYNRWGDLVFTISNYNNQDRVFRGTANKLTKLGAGQLPNGTYFFDIKVQGTHNLKKLRGFIVLKR